MDISQTLKVKDVQRKNRHDVRIFISLLVIIAAILTPSFLIWKPVPWQASNPASFVESLKSSFTGVPGRPYTPTIQASLTIDYFVLGAREPNFFRFHSLFGYLCKIIFLWLLLRALRVPANLRLLIALLSAIWPSHIESVAQPELRGVIAISLFSYAALYCATHIDSRRWLWWMVGASLCSVVAVGASMPWSALLLPGIPAVALWCSRRKTDFPWKRLVLPMAVLLLAIGFSFHASGYLVHAQESEFPPVETAPRHP